jgi:hypothetical protein
MSALRCESPLMWTHTLSASSLSKLSRTDSERLRADFCGWCLVGVIDGLGKNFRGCSVGCLAGCLADDRIVGRGGAVF